MKPERVQLRLPDWTLEEDTGELTHRFELGSELHAYLMMTVIGRHRPPGDAVYELTGTSLAVCFEPDDTGEIADPDVERAMWITDVFDAIRQIPI